MILSAIWAECGRLLNDPSNVRWTTDVLTSRINSAQAEILSHSNSPKSSAFLTPISGQQFIALSSVPMQIIRITKTKTDGTIVPFPPITRQELDFRFPDWQNWSRGEPLYWFYDESLTAIYLAPTPDADNAITNGLKMTSLNVPSNVVSATDVPFDSSTGMIPFHMAIVHWVASYCWMDNADPESLAKSKFHRSGDIAHPGQYELQIKRIISKFDSVEAYDIRIMTKKQGGRVWN